MGDSLSYHLYTVSSLNTEHQSPRKWRRGGRWEVGREGGGGVGGVEEVRHNSGAPARRRRASRAPFLIKFGNPSISSVVN